MGQQKYLVIEPGKVLVDHGPVTMSITASLAGKRLTSAAVAGAETTVALLGELAHWLPFARLPVADLPQEYDSTYPPVLRLMVKAVRELAEPDFTPMAAVAGSFSELAKSSALQAGADRVIVNNGGDISLQPDPAQHRLKLGIVSDLGARSVTHSLVIESNAGIGGIATSGLGGRSLTKGVATAVTVLAYQANMADAAATAIANATYVEDPAVVRCFAEEVDHLTDIPGHLVTKQVGMMGDDAVGRALERGVDRTRILQRQGMIFGALIFVQGKVAVWPESLYTGFREMKPSC